MVSTKATTKPQTTRNIHDSATPEELVVFCPACKAIQTVYFTLEMMMPTRKFRQENGQVYHDCGSTLPCRVYRG
jgi:hypothetical protein